MPAIALPAVLAGASSIIAGQTLVVFGVSLGVIGTGIFVAATSAALGFLAQQLAPEPSFPDLRPFRSRETQRIQQISQAITPWQLVYGFKRVSGPLIYATTTSSQSKLHLIIILAAHEIEAIDTVLINADPIYPTDIDANGDVVSGKYANNIKIKKHLGSTSQTADADLVAAIDEWTTEHRARGRAYLYIELTKNSSLFKSSVPGISAWIKGKKVKDLRADDVILRDTSTVTARDGNTITARETDTIAFSTNMADIIRDYITLARTQGGMGFVDSAIDDDTFRTAAVTCDEMVTTQSLAMDMSSIDTSTDEFLVAEDSALTDILQFQLGDQVQVTSTGSLPGGIAASTDYYVVPTKLIRTDHTDPGFKLAASLDDAIAGTGVSLTSVGSGIITVTRNAEPRYHGAGVVETSRNPEDVLDEMRLGCAARLAHVGNKWKIFEGKYVAPTISIDESDLRDNMTVSTRHASRERFNGVKGLYSAQINNGVATSYPSVTNATYVTDDGGITYWKDIDMSWVPRSHTAERIAKIELERHRREISVQWPGTLALFQLHAGLNVMVDNDRLGWSSKVFECAEVSFGQIPDEFRNPVLVTDLYLRETDAAVYTWASSEEGAELASPRTNLPGAFSITAPTGITIVSGTDQLYLKKDGTVVSRIKVTWTDPPSAFLDYVEVQVKRTADVNWEPAIRAAAGIEQSFIWDVADGDSYDIRLRAVGDPPVGPKSDFTATATHVVVGKTTAPANVTGFSVQQTGATVTFRWNQVADVDLAGYGIRFSNQGSFNWDSANELTSVTRGTLVTNAGLPPGSWTVGIKAFDTSGNESASATTANITVTNELDIIDVETHDPRWLGTLTDLVKHDVSGRLVPESQNADSTGANVFSLFVDNPPATASYETIETDIGHDADVRAWAARTTAMGPGESGTPVVTTFIDYHDTAGAYDGFEEWGIGNVTAQRFFKWKITLTIGDNVPYVDAFETTVDTIERSEKHEGLVIAPGGTTLTYDEPFFAVPAINVTAHAVSGVARYPAHENKTTTSVDIFVYDSTGADVGGTVDVTIDGA